MQPSLQCSYTQMMCNNDEVLRLHVDILSIQYMLGRKYSLVCHKLSKCASFYCVELCNEHYVMYYIIYTARFSQLIAIATCRPAYNTSYTDQYYMVFTYCSVDACKCSMMMYMLHVGLKEELCSKSSLFYPKFFCESTKYAICLLEFCG